MSRLQGKVWAIFEEKKRAPTVNWSNFRVCNIFMTLTTNGLFAIVITFMHVDQIPDCDNISVINLLII